MKFQSLIRILVAVSLFGAQAHAITVANYSDPTNDRFTNDPSFIGIAYNFSGVGRSTNTADTRWATLIGDNYFLSANHFHPDIGTQIQFTAGNSVSNSMYTYTVAGGFQVAGTDFWIGYTASSIDSSLARYSYSTTPANALADTGLSGVNVFMNGDRVSGLAGSPTSHTLGTNQIESFRNTGTTAMNTPQTSVNFAEAATFDQIVTFENISGDNTLNFTTHESQVATGDSGSPLFTTSGGNLIIQGTAWAVATSIPGNFIDTGIPGIADDPLETRNASFYNYIGSYETELANTIALIPAPIPEPSAFLLICVSIPLIFRRRR